MSSAYNEVEDTVTVGIRGADSIVQERQVTPLDLIDPRAPRASKEVRRERLDICKSCERIAMFVCGECHCFMPLKTWLAEAECPLGKWAAEHVDPVSPA